MFSLLQDSEEDGVPGEDEGSEDDEGSDEDGEYKQLSAKRHILFIKLF
jgi:hypothetical protein